MQRATCGSNWTRSKMLALQFLQSSLSQFIPVHPAGRGHIMSHPSHPLGDFHNDFALTFCGPTWWHIRLRSYDNKLQRGSVYPRNFKRKFGRIDPSVSTGLPYRSMPFPTMRVRSCNGRQVASRVTFHRYRCHH